jgi:hypothetical protein
MIDVEATKPEIKKAAWRGFKTPGGTKPLVFNQFWTATKTNTTAKATAAQP